MAHYRPAVAAVLLLGALVANRSAADAAESRTVRVAMCQIFSLDGDREGNLTRIEHAVREAKEQGADIACFPETVLLGWVNPEAHRRACPIPGEDSARLAALAKQYDMFLCIGLAEKAGNRLHDTALLIDNEGRILLRHRKINILVPLMRPPYSPGDSIDVADTPFGRIGVLICADTFKDEILTGMETLKPDLLLVPYGWAAPEDAWPDHGKSLADTVKKAALKTQCPTVGVDLVGQITHGPWRGRTYGGQSVAADRHGNVLGIARDRDRDVKIVRVQLGQGE